MYRKGKDEQIKTDFKGFAFTRPCKCCGRTNHSMLQVIERTHTQIKKVRLVCPLAKKTVPMIWKEGMEELIIWPTAQRFAEYHQYRKEISIRALVHFHKYGSGKWMNISRVRNFKNEVINECDKVYAMRNSYNKGEKEIDGHSCIN